MDIVIHEKYRNDLQSYALDNAEQELARYSFSDELSFIKEIYEGNPEGVRKHAEAWLGSVAGRIDKLAKKDRMQNEYMGVAAITLTTRAAIYGGLDPLSAYTMNNTYLQRLENCKSTADIYHLVTDVIISYAESVKQQKKQGSQKNYVEECKVFIEHHLNQPFTVDDIAEKIGFNKAYLSRRFSEAYGMGIQRYARMKRLEAAVNLLRFTDESILTISNYLCFSSQSHFGKVFKAQMGMTPQKYREKNKIADIDDIAP